MKLSRRSFLGFLSALVSSPLVARDMGDFDFLPPEPVVPFLPTSTPTRNLLPSVGQIRYNPNMDLLEVYTSAGWQIMETPLERENG